MSVIVDTYVWSLALRRKTPPDSSPTITLMRDLINDDQVAFLGKFKSRTKFLDL